MNTATRILVVDDDPGFRKGIARLLRANGYEVASYSSAEEFLANANLRDAGCLILDVHLDGISGIELRRRQRGSGHDVPVIFITGNSSEALQEAAMAAGCAAYLEKPCRAKTLMDAVSAALQGRAGSLPVSEQDAG